ncbi:MAG: hypothetical protein AUH15_12185 [Acidobacteriales bacterium 13_2_20CM_55_8]|nr:MAG: hypothetical protein AUH15_12185 [Acidobacteriales bacterium 13_2_20CM_55_8]
MSGILRIWFCWRVDAWLLAAVVRDFVKGWSRLAWLRVVTSVSLPWQALLNLSRNFPQTSRSLNRTGDRVLPVQGE